MRIQLIQVGKTRSSYLYNAEKEYLKRLQPFTVLKVITIKEIAVTKGESSAAQEIVKKKEAKVILKNLPKESYTIALDEHGQQLTSQEFAQFIRKKRDFEKANLTFIIGGCYGLAPEILQKVNYKLSFSALTFTHEMIRTLLLEQLYRAFSILSGKAYHHE